MFFLALFFLIYCLVGTIYGMESTYSKSDQAHINDNYQKRFGQPSKQEQKNSYVPTIYVPTIVDQPTAYYETVDNFATDCFDKPLTLAHIIGTSPDLPDSCKIQYNTPNMVEKLQNPRLQEEFYKTVRAGNQHEAADYIYACTRILPHDFIAMVEEYKNQFGNNFQGIAPAQQEALQTLFKEVQIDKFLMVNLPQEFIINEPHAALFLTEFKYPAPAAPSSNFLNIILNSNYLSHKNCILFPSVIQKRIRKSNSNNHSFHFKLKNSLVRTIFAGTFCNLPDNSHITFKNCNELKNIESGAFLGPGTNCKISFINCPKIEAKTIHRINKEMKKRGHNKALLNLRAAGMQVLDLMINSKTQIILDSLALIKATPDFYSGFVESVLEKNYIGAFGILSAYKIWFLDPVLIYNSYLNNHTLFSYGLRILGGLPNRHTNNIAHLSYKGGAIILAIYDSFRKNQPVPLFILVFTTYILVFGLGRYVSDKLLETQPQWFEKYKVAQVVNTTKPVTLAERLQDAKY